MASDTKTAIVPPKRANTDYPVRVYLIPDPVLSADPARTQLIDSDPYELSYPRNLDVRAKNSPTHLGTCDGYLGMPGLLITPWRVEWPRSLQLRSGSWNE